MTEPTPTILWLRRDLRIGDHPGWALALAGGGPVVPVFVLDPLVEQGYGAAPLWRLGLSLGDLARTLEARGSRLVLRRGDALATLREIALETGARRVVRTRLYDSRSVARDRAVDAGLAADGIEVGEAGGSLLFEPEAVATKTGGFYRVYTPYWRAVRNLDPGEPLPEPGELRPPAAWPRSDRLADWRLDRAMNRGAAVVGRFVVVGETAARRRLDAFLGDGIARYHETRDVPALPGTSGLAENLTYGEISPRTAWHAGRAEMERRAGEGAKGAETFLQELAWREFSYHLLRHTPELETGNWRREWDAFPWRDDNPDAEAWRRGMTGYEMVDAAMREMYVTGRMHNRMRMLTASFLTKHLLTHWRIGERWFRECLIDWDVAANSMGWQWSAGSGPDATPYFRVFNPIAQAAKFDADRRYRDRFLAEGRKRPHADALAFFDAAPRHWRLSPDRVYPDMLIRHEEGRERALEAYRNRPRHD